MQTLHTQEQNPNPTWGMASPQNWGGKVRGTPATGSSGLESSPMEHVPRFSHSSPRLTINSWLLLLRGLDRDGWAAGADPADHQTPHTWWKCRVPKMLLEIIPLKWWKCLEIALDGICFCLIINLHRSHNLCILQVICIIKTIKGSTHHGN